MFGWLKRLFKPKRKQVQKVGAGGVGIQVGGSLHGASVGIKGDKTHTTSDVVIQGASGKLSVKAQGNVRISLDGKSVVVHADNPTIHAPKDLDVKVNPWPVSSNQGSSSNTHNLNGERVTPHNPHPRRSLEELGLRASRGPIDSEVTRQTLEQIKKEPAYQRALNHIKTSPGYAKGLDNRRRQDDDWHLKQTTLLAPAEPTNTYYPPYHPPATSCPGPTPCVSPSGYDGGGGDSGGGCGGGGD